MEHKEIDYNNILQYIKKRCQKDFAQGKEIRFVCPYCGMNLTGYLMRKKTDKISDEKNSGENKGEICPYCGQAGTS